MEGVCDDGEGFGGGGRFLGRLLGRYRGRGTAGAGGGVAGRGRGDAVVGRNEVVGVAGGGEGGVTGLLPAAGAVALAFPGLAAVAVAVDDGAVDVDAGAGGVEPVGHQLRARTGAGLVAAVVARVRVRGDDAEELAVLLQAFFFAGVAVFTQGFAFVEQFDPPRVVDLELLGGGAAELADFEETFGDVEGLEVERVCGAFVLQDENVRSEVWRLGSAGVAVRWREAVAVVTLPTVRPRVGFVPDDVLVVFWLDTRGRPAGVGEGGVPPRPPEAAAHEEKESEERE